MKKVIVVIILAIAFFYSCKDSIVENEDKNVGRINFQEGTIEGIKTGDDTTAVIKLLGKPDGIGMGDFDGYIYEYENKNYPGIYILTVTFFNKTLNQHPGEYRVGGVSVLNSYSGKSKEGIGLGSSKTDVVKIFGNPQAVYEYGELYLFTRTDKKNNYVFFTYDGNLKVKSIGMDTRATN